MKFNNKISAEQLKEYKELPLPDKIKLSKEIINDFYDNVPSDKIYISSSFGKDSIVLIDLVRGEHPETPIVYINTGVEHPSCVELSHEYDNVIEIKPRKNIERIIDEHGYILPYGKDKTSAVAQVRKNIHDGKFDTWRMRQIRGEIEGNMYDYSKLQKVIFAPFKVSDKCCYWLKDQPIQSFERKTGKQWHYIGMTADESTHRKNSIRQLGFNTETQSRPLGHWTTQDILQYILDNNLKLAECYGDIYSNALGQLKTRLHQRNGCICCLIGSHVEKPNKFQLLHEYDYDSWEYVIYDLGLDQVLDYFGIEYTGGIIR